ncbi:ABC transporter permease [Mycoplasmoides fastidiosum]|nr:ABC transporter permease [Mycoplasmoides fastidiosum]
MVYSAATNLITNLTTSVHNINSRSQLHDAVINPTYGYGNGDFVPTAEAKYRSRVVTAINSTAARVYSKANGSTDYVLGAAVSPIHNSNATPPSCFQPGSQFSQPLLIYNFLNPNDLEFDTNGNLISTEILVTSQCGVTGAVSDATVLSAQSGVGANVVGYNYVKAIFGNYNTQNSDQIGINEISSGTSFLAKAQGVTDTSGQYNGLIPVARTVNEAVNELTPELENNQIKWTKSYQYFYNYFKNPAPNQPTFNLTNFDQTTATKYLEPLTNSLRVDSFQAADINNALQNLINKYNLNETTTTSGGGTSTPEKTYDLDKFVQTIYKIVFYKWKTIGGTSTIQDALNQLKTNNASEIQTYLGTNNTSFDSLSDPQKFIFTSTSNSNRAGFIELWTKLNNEEKTHLLDLTLEGINNSISANNNARSRDQMALIRNFIVKHGMWTVDNVLNDFEFLNPQTNMKETYNIPRNDVKSIIVNQTSESNNPTTTTTPTNSASQSTQTTNSANSSETTLTPTEPNNALMSYKIIQSNFQDSSAPDAEYVNKLIIFSGNELFYKPSYSNYQILQNWLNLRNIRRDLAPAQDIPFIRMLLRANFSSPKIREVFDKYLKILEHEDRQQTIFLTGPERIQIQDYLNQIQNGFWNYNGHELVFNFTSVDFFRPLNTIDAQLQKFSQVPAPAYLSDTTAPFIVVSPEFARHFDKKPISDEAYENFKLLANSEQINQQQWEAELNNFIIDPRNSQNILNAGGVQAIIVGTGLTADFVFPSISLFNLIPDPLHEVLVYVNENGYNKYLANNPAGMTENYISVLVPEQIKEAGLTTQFLDSLRTAVNEYAPSGTIFYNADDTSMTFSASAYRVVFVDNIIKILNLVSYFLIIIVAILTLFGVIVLVRRYFKNNSKVFGNLGANGISKLTIILSSVIFVTIPALIGPIIGYFVGLFTQNTLFTILSNYWFLDSSPVEFNYLTLIYYVLIPLGILGLVAIIASTLTLRASSLALMRESPIFKQNRFSLKLNGLYNSFTPLWKFRLIVATNSLPRILLLSGMSSLMIIVLVFIFSNIGQFGRIAENEQTTKRYDYAVQYRTPTVEHTQAPLLSYQQLGQTYLNNISQKIDTVYQLPNTTKPEKATLNVSPANPLLVASNINNFFQDSAARYGDQFNQQLADNPVTALEQLNQKLHFNPANTGRWARNSILSHFLLRSIWDESQKAYKSVSLPSPEEPKHRVFYYSSEAANPHGSQTTTNLNIINFADIQKHNSLFSPDITKQTTFYYSDYVPVEQANREDKKLILAPDGTPLFQPLSDLYRTKQPLLKNNNGTGTEYISYTSSTEKEINSESSTENQDFQEFDYGTNQKVKLPLLNRLYRDNANYWIFSMDDRANSQYDLNFLQNRVLVKILLDNTIKVNDFSLKLNINMWDIIRPTIEQASPAILNQIDKNNVNLIRNIIQSRYGAFFLNRFFSMHQLSNPVTNFNDGDVFNGEPSYLVRPEDLTAINNNPSSNETTIVPGLYYLDSTKTVYLYINPFPRDSDNHPENRYSIFALFRPDFLYLILSILNDPTFANPQVGPVKLTFGNQITNPDYNRSNQQWTTTGNPEVDSQQNVGITASGFSREPIDYDRSVNGDQTFTYLTGKIKNIDGNVAITGIKQDPRGSYLKLRDDNNQIINQRLYQEPEIDQTTNTPVYPMIINLFTAQKYNLGVGDYLDFAPDNDADRFAAKIALQPHQPQARFKIVGLNNTYFQSAFFVSQKSANTILGINPEYGYNGFFTKLKDPSQQPIQFTSALSVFSESGIYSPAQFDPRSAVTKELFLQPQTQVGNVIIPANLDILRTMFNLPANLTGTDDIINAFREVYGESIINPWITTLDDSSTTNLLFTKLSTTMQALVTIILIVFIPLLIIMVMMVTSLVIDDLKQLSVIMIMLGFNNWENAVTVLTYLIPVLAIALIVGVPLSVLFLQTYVGIILSAISLLIPIKMVPWYFLSSIGILVGIFTFAFGQSYIKLKRIFLPIAMKSFGD